MGDLHCALSIDIQVWGRHQVNIKSLWEKKGIKRIEVISTADWGFVEIKKIKKHKLKQINVKRLDVC